MRGRVDPQVWKAKILAEFKKIFPSADAFNDLPKDIDFHSLYHRIVLLRSFEVKLNSNDHWVFILLGCKRDSEAFKKVIDQDFNKIDSNGNTVLHYLALRGNGHAIEQVIARGALENGLNVVNLKGHSLFQYAILGCDIARREEVRQYGLYALRNGWRARVMYDDQGELSSQPVQPWLDALELILEKNPGAAKHITTTSDSALRFAVRAGDFSAVQFLVKDCQLNPKDKNFFEMTILHYAAQRGLTKFVKFFIEDQGMDPLERTGGRAGMLSNLSILDLARKSEVEDCVIFCSTAMEKAQVNKQANQANRVMPGEAQAPQPSAPSAPSERDLPPAVQGAGLFRLPPDNPATNPKFFEPPAPGK